MDKIWKKNWQGIKNHQKSGKFLKYLVIMASLKGTEFELSEPDILNLIMNFRLNL
jgi:hypothetical protein